MKNVYFEAVIANRMDDTTYSKIFRVADCNDDIRDNIGQIILLYITLSDYTMEYIESINEIEIMSIN